MKKKSSFRVIFVFLLGQYHCSNRENRFRTISVEDLKEKINGGWAGKAYGVSFSGQTEFQYQEKIDESVKRVIGQKHKKYPRLQRIFDSLTQKSSVMKSVVFC